ncbi:MAG: ABC transporter substrate-binding protein [Spirochaetaceae bacterium]|jgi:ABC-type glycerol-3-phosphate transport system substrate-binding protein|nr:ABC transporter substrate-binding protein [Spirochaetaceae bacterium]
MIKNVLGVGAAVFLGGLLVLSCSKSGNSGGGTASTAAGSKPLTAEELEKASGALSYWSAFTGDSLKWDQWRVDEFKKRYPAVTVDIQSVPQAGMTNGKLLAAIAGKTAPDVLVSDDYVSSFGFAGQGAFDPWDSYLEAINLSIGDFLPGFRSLMQYNGKTYLLPQDSNVIMLYLNTDMVAEAGLDIANAPTNLDELMDWAEKLTVRDGSGKITRYGFIPWQDQPGDAPTFWPFMFGAELYNQGTNNLELTDPKVVAAFQWMREWAKKYDPVAIKGFTQSAGGFFSPDHPFFQNKLAMTVTGNWVTNALRIYAPQVNYTVVPVPVPAGGREKSTPLGSNVFAIPKGSKRPDLAALFFKFTQRTEINADNFDTWRSIPCIDSLFDQVSWTQKNDPIYSLERQIANSSKSAHPALCPVSAELNQQLIALRDNIIYNDADPQGLLQELQNKLQPELDKLAKK